jgi:hypothetical protein
VETAARESGRFVVRRPVGRVLGCQQQIFDGAARIVSLFEMHR